MTISLLSRAGRALLGLYVVVFLGWGVDGLLSAQVFVVLLVLPLALYLIRKDITINIETKWVGELVRFGYPFIFVNLAFWIFGSVDRWMLAWFGSLEEVGTYSVAFRFSTLVLFVSNAIGMAWSPVAIKIRTDSPEKYRYIFSDMLLILLFIMLVVGGGLALFSGELIALVMTEEYVSSALPLSILCFGIAIQSSQQITAIGISLEKKTFLFARLAWATALVNILLNWLLIPRFGSTGAALATTLSYLLLTSSYLFFTQRLHTLPISWKRLFMLLTLGCAVMFVSIEYNSTVFSWSLVGMKLLFAVICLAIGWLVLPVSRIINNSKVYN
jgi:O-antigen/teichoic acid export membrane protein